MNIDESLNSKDLDNNQKEVGTEQEEEEALVLVQFTDQDDALYCQQFSSQKFKTIDITAKNPIIQIGNRLYTGEYTNNIGTYLLFEEKGEQQQEQSSSSENFDYSGKTFKKLVLTRLFVEEKASNQQEKKTEKQVSFLEINTRASSLLGVEVFFIFSSKIISMFI